MAVVYTCDRCGYKSINSNEVIRYTLSLTSEHPVQTLEVDLCKTCTETAWRAIREQLFRGERQARSDS